MSNQDKRSDSSSCRIVLFYLREAASDSVQPGIALVSPRVEHRFGDEFLVGVVPEETNDWASGLHAGVRRREVVHFLEFDSLEDYQQRIARAPAAWEIRRSDRV